MSVLVPPGYEPTVDDAHCPSRRTLELICDKWTLLVLRALERGDCGYLELSRIVDGITRRMLTRTLREAERNGLIERDASTAGAARVAYRLSPLGHTLIPHLHALAKWAEAHMTDVLAAQARAQGNTDVPS